MIFRPTPWVVFYIDFSEFECGPIHYELEGAMQSPKQCYTHFLCGIHFAVSVCTVIAKPNNFSNFAFNLVVSFA